MPLTFNSKPHLTTINNNTEVTKNLIHDTLHFNCPDSLLHFYQNMFEWIEKNPDLEQYKPVSKDDILYERSNLFITNIPEKKNQFLIKLRKLLHIEDSIVTLSKSIEHLPLLIKEDFYPIKYKKEISELNTLYQCLQLKTKDGNIINL